MTSVLFLATAVAAAVWVAATARRHRRDGPLGLIVAFQLGALSFVSGPEELIGDTAAVIVAGLLVAAAITAVAVYWWRSDRWHLHYTGWMVLYGIVLIAAMALSSSPEDSVLRTARAILLPLIFLQVAAGLDRRLLQQLFGQLMIGAATVVILGAVLVPDEAFRALRAPVIKVSLTAPVLGFGPHWTGLIGLGLIAATVMNGSGRAAPSLPWSTALSPDRERFFGWLGVGVGLAILILPLQRAFWLAAVVAALTHLVLRRRRLLIPAALGIAVVSLAFVTIGPLRDLWDREQSRPVDNIFSIRGEIFGESLDRFAARPIVGDGLGVGNRNLLIDLGQPGFNWSSHSELGAVLAATGILGLLALIWAHGHGLAGAIAAWRRDEDPLPLIVLAALITLLPFWRVLQEPLLLSLVYYVYVLPSHRPSVLLLADRNP